MSYEAKTLMHYVEALKSGVDVEWTLNAIQAYAAHLIAHGL